MTPRENNNQKALFDMQAELPPAEPEQSIEEFVEDVRIRRAEAITALQNPQLSLDDVSNMPDIPKQTVAVGEERRGRNKGGAFGGALKRHIEQTDQAAKLAATNEQDIQLLAPTSINRELFHQFGDQAYKGVVFTPEEFKAITFSPEALAQRIGANVLSGTTNRPATVRHERKSEVLYTQLAKRQEIVQKTLDNLEVDEWVFATLLHEMRSPGYAHMDQDWIDALMAHAEWRFVSMFEAITTNHGAGTERVESLKSALDYLLNNDYKKAFNYWRHMSNLGQAWTRAKIERFRSIESDIQEELVKRFGTA
ncbi:MAG TPA: hypothetical protein VFI84_01705 [Candidatus Saccharimonadales bacterium]|nr:hypothetical protein [Candidatus Saccharimonadales bacterium]